MTNNKNSFSKGFGKINKVKSTKPNDNTPPSKRMPKNKKKEKEEDDEVVVENEVPKKKQGRPSTKNPETNYVRVTATIPETVRDAMKVALYSTFKEVHTTQDDFVSAAIEFYIANYKEQEKEKKKEE